MYNDLKGKFVLVTGSASKLGMGHDACLRLAQEGCIVAVHGRPGKRTNPDDIAEGWEGVPSVVKEIEDMGGKAIPVYAELTDVTQVEEMFKKIDEEFGRIDVVVHCASISGPGFCLTEDFDYDMWHKVQNSNGNSFWYVAKEAIKRFKEQKSGNLIVISSVMAKHGGAGTAAYNCAKGANITLSRTIAREVAEYGIRSNCLVAGGFATDMPVVGTSLRQLMKEGMTFEEAVEHNAPWAKDLVPMKRVAPVREMSSVIAFMASEESSFITGQAINVDGGFMMTV